MNPALLVIDCQNDFIKGASPYSCEMLDKALIDKIKKLIDACRQRGVPIIYTQHSIKEDKSNAEQGEPADVRACIVGTRGWEIIEKLKPKQGEIVVMKDRADAFYNTTLEKALRQLGAGTLIICGVLTNNCVRQTAEAAYGRNYKIILVSDCCGATSFVAGISNRKVNEITLKELKERTYRTEVVILGKLEKTLM